ncbi:Peroxin-3 [Halteromyces radiatus]|uniref:Peroxin-3 n=1 Tax=Halteromyces radiatus TaxID=101107 RepID=UPI00222058B8|nr:Peroxin-3 [Halteromyces radiatus]KAI8099208.1 Peroxin-3 [Halteromyces radiatus]
MTLLTSLKDFTKRHRRGLIVTATLAGGTYLAGRYATNKIKEYQEKSTSERLAKENLKRRFQQNQNDCVFTVLALLPTLGDQILYEMNVEASWTKLQESRKLEKLELKKKQDRALRKQQRQEEKEARMVAQLEAVTITEEEEAKQTTTETPSTVVEETSQPAKTSEDIKETTSEEDDALKKPLDMSVGSISDSVYTTGTGSSSMVVVDQDQGNEEEDDDDDEEVIPEGLLDKKAKYLLWEDIKVTSFTRTLTTIYSVTLLTMLTHIQLNLLGRFTYVWSVSVLNKSEPTIRLQHDDNDQPENGFLDPLTERMFLSASWWLLHRGWRKCAERVKDGVEQVVGSIPLKSILTYDGTEEIIQKLRKNIEYEDDGYTPFSFRSWMLPDTHEEELELLRETGFSGMDDTNESTVTLRQLLDETKDFIDSPDFITVFSCCLEEVYSIFDHNAFGKVLLPSPLDSSVQRIQELTNDSIEIKKMTLANLLPAISRQAHLVIAGNEYLNGFAYLKELQAFSAMIYTQYGQEVTSSS